MHIERVLNFYSNSLYIYSRMRINESNCSYVLYEIAGNEHYMMRINKE